MARPYLFPSGALTVLAPGAGPEDPEWHAVRATGLGGSDQATILGLDKYSSPLGLWHEKTGTPAPRRDNPVLDEAALMGHILEPVVARRFTDLTGLPAYEGPGTLRAIEPEWALANLDRVTLEGGRYGVLELKTRSSYALDDWLDEPPTGPYLQVQHYLMVTGWTYGYIACLVGGQRTIVHRVERDDDLIAGMLTVGAEFWQRVQDGTPPRVDGTPATRDLLHQLHPADDGGIAVADPVEVERLIRDRARAKADGDAVEARLLTAENRMKEIAGDAAEVHIRGELAYSWRTHLRLGVPVRTLRVHMETL
ncbi:YqaJ viral recombinase family nuclease [Kitasatospora indigofera]|uniref:YqaJ viral recombinase family nuclease n=1 Tax=Kitasatospora indigofera TaxID=67307 RepID=UPI0036C0047B